MILLKDKKKTVQKSSKKLSVGEKLTKNTQKKVVKKTVPRTCAVSPIISKKNSMRLESCDNWKVKGRKESKVSLKSIKTNFKTQVFKEKGKFAISPIKKVRQSFLNPDETSLIRVLEILSYQ